MMGGNWVRIWVGAALLRNVWLGLVFAVLAWGDGVIPFKEALHRLHVGTTEPELIEALKNPDPVVRGLAAANLLMEDRARDAIPEVRAALEIEKDESAKGDLAFSLAVIGEEAGFAELTRECDDRSFKIGLRLRASGQLDMAGKAACLSPLLDVLQSNDRPIGSVLQTISGLRNLSEIDAQMLSDAVAGYLNRHSLPYAELAGQALVRLGRPSAIPALREAMAHQSDPDVALAILWDIVALMEGKR